MKTNLVLTSVALSLWACAASANGDSTADLQSEVDALRVETNTLREEVDTLKENRNPENVKSGLDAIGIGIPYFNIDSKADNVRLLIDLPQVNKDVSLLLQRDYLDNDIRVMLSGNIAGSAEHHSNSFGRDAFTNSNLLAEAELDVAAFITRYTTGYFKLKATTEDSASEDSVSLDQAFINHGNIVNQPFYVSAGRYFLPTGDFGSVLVTHNLTEDIARIRANAVTLGLAVPGLYTSAFAFDGPVNDSSRTSINEWGLNFQIDDEFLGTLVYGDTHIRWQLGASYVNNLASSQGISDTLTSGVIQSHIGSYNLRGHIGVEKFTVGMEYLQATKRFQAGELSYNGQGAKPRVISYDAAYNFDAFRGLPSTLGISYQLAQEALLDSDVAVPRKQYGIAYIAEVTDNTTVGVEYIHKSDYAAGTSGGLNDTTIATGNNDNVFTLKADLFF